MRGRDRNTALWQFSWQWLPGDVATRDADLLTRCAQLYGTEYGVWGPHGPRPGQRVQIAPGQLADLLQPPGAWLACAFHDDRLVGYCAALQLDLEGRGRVAWVTQLVVESSFRHARVATNLLYGVWQFSDCYAWGLATANPFAVRALETATRRTCRSSVICELGPEVLAKVSDVVTYLPADLIADADGKPAARVNTKFFVDLGDLEAMREAAARGDRPWDLGMVAPGQEWLACTFRTQAPSGIDSRRIADLLEGADEIWIAAYEGMTLTDEHAWRRYTDREVDDVITLTGASAGAVVLDIGCGDGRHATELSARGLPTTGIDISERLVRRASSVEATRATFAVMDARERLPDGPFDLVLCLYDVLGSSARQEDDAALLRNVRNVIAKDGTLVLSVMNQDSVLPRLEETHRPGSIPEFVAALEALAPSPTMQDTGAIFDPGHLLYFTGAFYRKEQFDAADWRLPSELVVRDRRYSPNELVALVEGSGFELVDLRPVRLGHWSDRTQLASTDQRAKELLMVARPSW